MPDKFLPFMVVVLLSFIGAMADGFLKLASREHQAMRSPWFWLGAVSYFGTAFVWVYVLRHIRLGVIGLIYSYSTVGALIFVGVVFFGETLSRMEVLGIVLGFISLGLLGRFF